VRGPHQHPGDRIVEGVRQLVQDHVGPLGVCSREDVDYFGVIGDATRDSPQLLDRLALAEHSLGVAATSRPVEVELGDVVVSHAGPPAG